VTVEAIESTAPVGSTVSSGNSPQTHDVTLNGLSLKPIGFTIAPKPGQPVTSIGNGLAFFNDTAYGGPGNDRLDGGPGDDWLVGGHWLGPGCACAGTPYEATLLQQQAADGGHFYVDPASLPTPGSIQGRVWIDANPNNQDIDGEAGLGGMQVNLF